MDQEARIHHINIAAPAVEPGMQVLVAIPGEAWGTSEREALKTGRGSLSTQHRLHPELCGVAEEDVATTVVMTVYGVSHDDTWTTVRAAKVCAEDGRLATVRATFAVPHSASVEIIR